MLTKVEALAKVEEISKKYEADRIYDIELSKIFADAEFNSRGVIDPTSVIELAKSISDRGLDQPISLQPWVIESRPNIEFRIIMGYRRYMAHVMNKAPTIRAQIREGLSDVEARVMNLTENLHRENLNPLQEAKAIGHLKDLKLSEFQVASRVGKSRGWVQERFMLLSMPEAIQQDAAAGLISLKHVRKAYSLNTVDEKLEFIKKVKDAKLLNKRREPTAESVRTVNEKRTRTAAEIFDLQDIIRENLGNSFATQALGWAAGILSDLEIHRAIMSECEKKDKFYIIPEGLVGSHAIVTETVATETVDAQT